MNRLIPGAFEAVFNKIYTLYIISHLSIFFNSYMGYIIDNIRGIFGRFAEGNFPLQIFLYMPEIKSCGILCDTAAPFFLFLEKEMNEERKAT